MQRHFTATAFVVDAQKRALLIWHKRLQRWMPPGGHIEPNELPEEAALRECKEETGLDVEILGDAQDDLFSKAPWEGRMLKKPFAILLEEIPASPERNEPAHQHIDFSFVARLLDPTQTPKVPADEGDEIRWFTRDEIGAMDDQVEIFSNVKEFLWTLLDPRS